MIVRLVLVAALVAAACLAPEQTALAGNPACSGYRDYVNPPTTIRVLRQYGSRKGYTQVVDFRSWVKHVVGTEMPSFYPYQTLRAQALFVKQYGWYYSMNGRWRGGVDRAGHCYDVKDTGDGFYRPERYGYTTKQGSAVDTTWRWSVNKWSGHAWRFIATGYRAGAQVGCGTDADGYHLFQHSAFRCGRAGLGWQAIVGKYLSSIRWMLAPR